MSRLTNATLLEAVFGVMIALQRGVTPLRDNLPMFLQQSVQALVEPTGSSEEVREFWQLMAADDEAVNTLTYLDPIWKDGSLFCFGTELDEQMVHAMGDMCRYFLRFQAFSRTRWGTVPKCCCYFTRAIVLGLEPLHDYAKEISDMSFYSLLSFTNNNSAEVKYLCMVGALALLPGESFHLRLLSDDRLLMFAEEYWSELQGNLTSIHCVLVYSYEHLSAAIDCDPVLLRG